ncbi:carbonic anhydrase [Parvularcula sp. LCG005]|uniref:carbonic anhydrase n=1 Tax=Parvularcula sp. LCG005 TaxID=3078805 RepID=UPI0029424342|nr:carbonic anhydrase family protein [Parvularcula sp. LCG005]WOI54338.1 carbonic anhydrase family protein [Parvularcula sp. LCG005]
MSPNAFRLLLVAATAAIAACSAQGSENESYEAVPPADGHGAGHEASPVTAHAAPKDDGHGQPAGDHGDNGQKSAKNAHHDPAHWTYAGESGPDYWAAMSHDFSACSTGTMQSPIDLSTANAAGDVMIQADYRPAFIETVNNGHTVQVNTTGGLSLSNGRNRYHLAQFHFHTPSEHTINGQHYPMEMHFVHKDENGELLVLGVLFEEGASNPNLNAVLESLSRDTYQFDPSKLLPANLDVYRYQGSLTTPPCSEGVNWHVVRQPVTASIAQIRAFQQLMGENARPIQAVNNRLVVRPL